MGLNPSRVAEVQSTGPAGSADGRASGYLVTGAVVLTAEHAVRGRTGITVRFNADQADEWSVPASVMWSDAGEDGALLRLGMPRGADSIASAAYGRIGDRAAVVDAVAVGFPWWKLRAGPAAGQQPSSRYRDMHQAVCTISTLSNRRSHTLELGTLPPDRRRDAGRSPWEGMSGAAVWVGNRIVGVVREHALAEGPNHLTATRIDRLIRAMPPSVQRAIGVESSDDAVDVLDLLAVPPTPATAPAASSIGKDLVGAACNMAFAALGWFAGARRPRQPDHHVPQDGHGDGPDDWTGDSLSAMDGGDGPLLDWDA
jgi:hypothetical protein